MSEIRLALSSDAKVIIGIDPLSQTDPKRTPFIMHALNTRTCHLVESEGKLVGYGVLDYSFYQYGFVSMLYIHPEFRRKGFGTALIRHFETICKTDKMFTSTNQSNKPMQQLLTKIGYRPSGVIENLDEGDPELVFFKRVSPYR